MSITEFHPQKEEGWVSIMEQNSTKISHRVVWLDSLKGFAIFAVVLGHALLGFEQSDAFPADQNMISMINAWIYTWHMPLFFVLSGAAFRISCLKDGAVNFPKIKKNALNLFILYLIFDTILPVLKMIFARFVNNPVSFWELGRMILLPSTLMWYLWVLIIYYFFFAFLFSRKIGKLVPALLLLCCSLAANYLYQAEIFMELCVKNLFYCSVFFYMGMYFREWEQWVLWKSVLAAAGCLMAVTILYLIVTHLVTDGSNVLVDTLLGEANAFAVIIVCSCLFQKISAVGNNAFLIMLGKNSLVIYLLHTYFVTALRVVVGRLGISSALIAVTLCTVLPLAVTIGISLLVPRIPVLAYVFKPILLVDKCRQNGKNND